MIARDSRPLRVYGAAPAAGSTSRPSQLVTPSPPTLPVPSAASVPSVFQTEFEVCIVDLFGHGEEEYELLLLRLPAENSASGSVRSTV